MCEENEDVFCEMKKERRYPCGRADKCTVVLAVGGGSVGILLVFFTVMMMSWFDFRDQNAEIIVEKG
jgi:hypothetical protein